MKKTLLIFITFICLITISFGQTQYQKAQSYLGKKGEVFFTFNINNKSQIRELSKIISIDKVNGLSVYAYANKKGFEKFNSLNINYEVLNHPSDLIEAPKMFDFKIKSTNSWDAYPTYDSYIAMMNQYQTNYPAICKVFPFGTTENSRFQMTAKLSNNVNVDTIKPRVLLMSTIHGDEVTGYIILLRMIDYLTSNYGTNYRITNLINNNEIWICPLLNPDGTYNGGNNTVNGAIRYNKNGVDLNRNFPNQAGGAHPDGEVSYARETSNMMHLYDSLHFVMSFVMHGGSEVVNYPFDTWDAATKTHADDAWWQSISKKYVDTTRVVYPNYMTDVDPSGYVNGGDWYVVEGSCQDYETYFKQGREVTIEVNSTKLPSATLLPNYWNYNYRSILNYIDEASKGIRGIITDSCTGLPMRARIEILAHDRDSSHVYSDTKFGAYYRPIQAGTYNVKISATGFADCVINNVSVSGGTATIVNAKMHCYSVGIAEAKVNSLSIFPNPSDNTITISNLPKTSQITIINELGIEVLNTIMPPNSQIDISKLSKGVYFIKVMSNEKIYSQRIIKQ